MRTVAGRLDKKWIKIGLFGSCCGCGGSGGSGGGGLRRDIGGEQVFGELEKGRDATHFVW